MVGGHCGGVRSIGVALIKPGKVSALGERIITSPFSDARQFRTPHVSVPFTLFGICKKESQMAEMLGNNPNSLFEILEDWEHVLQAENIDFEELGL